MASSFPKDLVHSSDDQPGYTRKGSGTGFSYYNQSGELVTDDTLKKRLNGIGVPPAMTDVWICENPNGHLQATGRDEKGRKQYYYHVDWQQHRNLAKFNRLRLFGEKLPALREQINKDLRKRSWQKEKAVALAVSLMDECYLRIGNESYRQKNQTYGLTTLRRKHLEETTSGITFEYKAKSNKMRKVKVKNSRLVRLIKSCAALPGYELFKYYDEEGNRHGVSSHDVNDYLHQHSSEKLSAKYFRTWGGSVLALEKLEEAQQLIAENPRRKLETVLVQLVAKELGNTVTVCRKYYIHPSVLSCLTVQGEGPDFQEIKKRAAKYGHTQLDEAEKEFMTLLDWCST